MKTFHLPISNYEILCKIIAACPLDQDRLVLSRIAGACEIDEIVVYGNMGFLVSMDIVHGGMAKRLTARGKSLAMALNLNHESEIRMCWKLIFSDCDRTRLLFFDLESQGGVIDRQLFYKAALALNMPMNPLNRARIYKLLNIFERVSKPVEQEDPAQDDSLDSGNDNPINPCIDLLAPSDEETIFDPDGMISASCDLISPDYETSPFDGEAMEALPRNSNIKLTVKSQQVHLNFKIKVDPDSTEEEINQLFEIAKRKAILLAGFV